MSSSGLEVYRDLRAAGHSVALVEEENAAPPTLRIEPAPSAKLKELVGEYEDEVKAVTVLMNRPAPEYLEEKLRWFEGGTGPEITLPGVPSYREKTTITDISASVAACIGVPYEESGKLFDVVAAVVSPWPPPDLRDLQGRG